MSNLFDKIFSRLPPGSRLFPDDVVEGAAPSATAGAAAPNNEIQPLTGGHEGHGSSSDEDDLNIVGAVQKEAIAKQRNATKATALLRDKQATNNVTLELVEDDAAIQEALNFTLGNPLYDPDEHMKRKLAAAAPDLDEGDQGDALVEIVPGDGKIYRGKCCMFSAERKYGFIRPKAKDHDDLYFAEEDIRTAKSFGESYTPLQCLPLMLFPDEEVEFNVEKREGSKKLRAVNITAVGQKPVRSQSNELASRHVGSIRHWNLEKQYGFIAPNEGGQSDVFFHVSSIMWDPTVLPPQQHGGGGGNRGGGGSQGAHLVEVGFIVEYSAFDRPGQKPCGVAITSTNMVPLNPETVMKSSLYKKKEEERVGEKRDRDAQDDGSPISAPKPGQHGLLGDGSPLGYAPQQLLGEGDDEGDGVADW